MKISIVTISYNQVAFLRRCIDSVLSQDVDDLEYIIVDPGSTDGSREIVESYGDRIIKVFESDSGPSDGLNKGFSKATGDIFGFINSDDYLLQGALKKILTPFEKDSHKVFYSGSGFIKNVDGSLQQVKPTKMKLFPLLYGACTIFQQGTFFTAEMFKNVGGFNSENRTCWDLELFCEFLAAGCENIILDENIAAFCLHEGSISGSGRLEKSYRADLRRIFRNKLGKDYGALDSLISVFFRAKKVISRHISVAS